MRGHSSESDGVSTALAPVISSERGVTGAGLFLYLILYFNFETSSGDSLFTSRVVLTEGGVFSASGLA